MASRCLCAKLVFGLAAASAAALAAALSPASAQIPIETVIQPPAAQRPKAAPPRRPAPEQVNVDDPEVAATQPAGETPEQPTEEGEDPEGEDGPKTERIMAPTGGNAGRDPLGEPRAPVDGVVEDGRPGPVTVDGFADLNRDPRRPEDIAAFRGQPAGYDAIAFQIEALDPLNDRRTDRLFRFEPYDPVGIRIGSFVIFPEAELGLLTNSNIFRSRTPAADYAWDTRGTVRAVSDWRMHALELRASGRASFYDHYVTEDDRNWSLEARGRLDLSRRSNLEFGVQHLADKDVRALIDAPTNAARRGDITTDRIAAAYNQQLGRVTVQLRGSLSEVNYSSVLSNAGTTINNDSRNYSQGDGALRIAYAMNRRAAAFIEGTFRDREYAVAPADGIARSSTSERYRAGIVFSPLGSTLRGEVSVGWGWLAPKDGRLPSIEGYLIDSSLAWRASAKTSFLLTVRSDFFDTTAANSPGTLSREVGVEMRHAFQRTLIGSIAARYARSPYENLSLEDKLFTGEIGLDYYMNANVSLYGRLQHLDFKSTDTSRNYIDDIVRVGIRIRQ